MPTYEYACAQCGHELEARQKFDDAPLTACPACGKNGLERLVSRSSFALKGSGWYADGYGAKTGDSSKPDAEKPKTANAEPAKAEPAKTETTAAASKTESAPKETSKTSE